jgi:glycosyltransferase involved in cell wall biosynthesis
MIETSVIISFYQRIDYLKLVFAGLEKQTFPSFEVIIADDGSNQTVVKELENIAKISPLKLTHLWQEDEGFRKNKALNKSIIAAKSDYIIFIDGDCIPHPEFIKEHFYNRETGICLTGRRVNLSQKFSNQLTSELIEKGFLENVKLNLILDGIFGRSFDVEKGFYFNNEFMRKYFNKKKRGLLGCNFSIHKDALIKINGFDERYVAPSIGEDTDLQFRLEQIGTEVKSLNNIAIQYHLYHELQKRSQINKELFEQVKNSKQYYTFFGIEKIK